MRRARVLLAEDHTIMRQGTRQLLEADGGFEVIGEAADGEEALRLADLLRPDILVLDINLPRLHGAEVARRLRATTPGLRIVVLTGYDGEQYARALLRLGVDGYLVKTASGGELAQALRSVQAGRRYVQPAACPLVCGGRLNLSLSH